MNQSSTKKALVVEDHPDMLKILVLEMGMMGFSVTTASNGRDGVKKALEEKPHMILMDIMMPFMDGIDAIRVIRSNPKTRNVPILVTTALVNKIALRKCIDAGCNDYLTKPFTFKDLQGKIQDLVPSVCNTGWTTAWNKRLALFSNQADIWRRTLAALQDAIVRFRDYISRQNRRVEILFREPREKLGPGTQNLIENDVSKVTEVESLMAEREQLRGIIQSLKEECSALITESDEHFREMEEFQAVVREVLKDVSEMDGSFNKDESPGQLDQAFSGLHPRKGRPILVD